MRKKYIITYIIGRSKEYRIVRGADIKTALAAFEALGLSPDRIISIAEV